MSDQMQSKHPQSASEIRVRASEWLVKRYDSEGWSESDQTQLNSWLGEAAAHKIAYLRVEAASKRADRLGALRRPTPAPGRFIPALKVVAAAAVIVVIFGAYLFATQSGAPEKIYVTGVGGHESLTLRDGSKIELNTDTSLRITDKGAKRLVSLDKGEAYFQIVHDATRPFIVIVGNHRVTDLGTRFLVRRSNDTVRVSLLQGQAQFDTEDSRGKQQATLNPGDVVIATATSLSIAQAPTNALDDELGWRRGVLVFRHATLAQAAAEFNRYNLQKIVVTDPSVAKLNINGALRANDPQTFVRSMKVFFDIRVKVQKDAIILSR